MPEITAESVKKLRERTNLPMMKCKEALQQTNGDEEAAVNLLKSQVKGLLDKRGANATKEGAIKIKVKPDGSEAAMVEVQCESAPVATGEDLQKFADLLVQQLLEGPGAATPDDLMKQKVPGGKGTFAEMYEDLVNRIREKIVLARIAREKGPVGGYVHHDGKTGVLFTATGTNGASPVLRDVAMHIAALRPSVTNVEDLPQEGVNAERERLSTEARASGKPENIIAKMVEGRMKNYYTEQGVLVNQPFAKDDTKTVSQALAEQGLKAKTFLRWVIGG
jgi:elongation factor Ts